MRAWIEAANVNIEERLTSDEDDEVDADEAFERLTGAMEALRAELDTRRLPPEATVVETVRLPGKKRPNEPALMLERKPTAPQRVLPKRRRMIFFLSFLKSRSFLLQDSPNQRRRQHNYK